MFTGAHVLVYSRDADADRTFFRDVLKFPFVDVGHGWLIFALPPAEAAVHPASGESGQRHSGHEILTSHLYLMCDDLQALIAELAAKQVKCTEIETEPWGIRTTIRLPSGGELGLYQPTHPTALGLKS
jgi:catechol 2,3-dioxygenase-like lactoylglutathione lyase family enzyme